MDSYSKLGVFAVWFQTAPLEAFGVARKLYRKLAALGVFPVAATVPYTAQTYLVTATGPWLRMTFLESDQVSLCDFLESRIT